MEGDLVVLDCWIGHQGIQEIILGGGHPPGRGFGGKMSRRRHLYRLSDLIIYM